MSILFIGQGRPLVNSSISMSDEGQLQQTEKRRKQQIYRQQLLLQIRQKKERGRREKDYLTEVKPRYWPHNPLKTPNIFRKDPLAPSNYYSSEESSKRHFIDYMEQLKKQTLQSRVYTPLHCEESSLSSFSPLKFDSFAPMKFDFSHLNRREGESRLKTESIYDRRAQENYDWSLQERQHELRSYEDKKIEQVYRKMQESVEAMNGPEDYSPLTKSRFRGKREIQPLSRSRLGEAIQNPQQLDLYQLPPRLKQSRKEVPDGGRSWKERFARLKLRELENYYQQALIDRQAFQGGERAQTPSFHRRK